VTPREKNKWLGQYPGNQEGVQQPYQDSKCMFDSLKETNPICVYITLQDVRKDKRRKQNDKNGGIIYFSPCQDMILTTFLEKHLPLSNHIHGPFKMMPPSCYIPLVAD
jgi:hypothetical protein